ncbi:hypothetical protein B0H14DRAFT_3669534 [Mycena olivaceomarginata]|nr:hypothetical protein B0H14DRAFT_3669534 [Mycena olivaceomarginata]
MKTEEPEPKAFQTDDPYAKAAPPRVLMISLEEAEKQADKLKVEIETLTESLAQERARADTLRALADAGIKEKIGLLILLLCRVSRHPPAWSAESFVPTKGARTESSPTSTHRSGPQMASILIESHHHRFVDIVWSLIDPRLAAKSPKVSHPIEEGRTRRRGQTARFLDGPGVDEQSAHRDRETQGGHADADSPAGVSTGGEGNESIVCDKADTEAEGNAIVIEATMTDQTSTPMRCHGKTRCARHSRCG